MIIFLKRTKFYIRFYWRLVIRSYGRALYSYKRLIETDLYPNPKSVNYDLKLLCIAENIFKSKNIKLNYKTDSLHPKILMLASIIYDFGGHTEFILRYMDVFAKEYPIDFYLTGIDNYNPEIIAPIKSQKIKKMSANYIVVDSSVDLDERIVGLYNYILQNKITTVNVYIHPHDVVSGAVLGLLRKYTNINIIFWNHADHYYSLGTEFAHCILTRCNNGKAVTPYLSARTNVLSIPVLEGYRETVNYSDKDILEVKKKLKIPTEAFVTITGCSFSKVSLAYFELIKRILNKNKNVYHIFISSADEKKIEEIRIFFWEYANRFIFLNTTPEFDLYLKTADLFIDSFPQGSALALIDSIRLAKPVVIKINRENPLKSFEEYLYNGYEYACKTVDDMYEKINKLIIDKQEYNKVSRAVREYYCQTFNTNVVKEKYKELIK